FFLAQGAGRWLVTGAIRALGIVSYSGYLWHFAIIELLDRAKDKFGINPFGIHRLDYGALPFLICFGGIVLSTAALSWLTFRYIETPGIAFGRALAARISRAQGISKNSFAGPSKKTRQIEVDEKDPATSGVVTSDT